MDDSLVKELASICKDLRLVLGKDDLVDKALCAYAAMTDTESPHVDVSYTSMMRDLRRKEPDKVHPFQVAFKKAFDSALVEEIDEPENVALMAAMKAIGMGVDDE